jgi:S-formylglutathione hydrolase FrmB
MSMGGYCAIDQGLRHADQFATILSLLPYGSPGKAGPAMKSNQTEIDAVTPLHYISKLDTLKHYQVTTWFAVDDSEVKKQVGLEAQKMARALKKRGQTVETYIAPNQGHTWAMTIASFPTGLKYWYNQMQTIM